MLTAKNLSASRGNRILFRKINFELPPGKVVRVTGENGSGKTTLLRTAAGLTRPDSGQVRWNQQPLRQAGDDYFQHMAYLSHLNALQGELTVAENLRLGGRLTRGRSVAALLEQTGLNRAAKLPARYLSQGQGRRLALAILVGKNARLWILDEPLVSLDHSGIVLTGQLCRKHIAGGGMILLATHQEMEFPGDVSQTIRLGA